MILMALLVIPIVGGLAAWVAGTRSHKACRWISLLAMAAGLALTTYIWMNPQDALRSERAGSVSDGTNQPDVAKSQSRDNNMPAQIPNSGIRGSTASSPPSGGMAPMATDSTAIANGAKAVARGTSTHDGSVAYASGSLRNAASGWLAEFGPQPWIPQFGISLHLAVDGLSLPLVGLAFLLGLLAVATSWTEIHSRVGFFHLNLLFMIAGIVGTFISLDLFLFYFFYELMLVPLYFVIGIWGAERRVHAALKFFIFTQGGGLLMLIAILGLYFAHKAGGGAASFDYQDLIGTGLSFKTGMWLMLGFLVAFAVKLPAVPLHTWLPDAHTQAPSAGSVILAGLVLKVGGYGMLRFLWPLFPEAAAAFATTGMIIGVVGILYGALMAFAQTDVKRLVAYSSVSHMGFVMLGVFAWNQYALVGALVVMLAHGISTGALFTIVGQMYQRLHTRDMDKLGGLWAAAPRMGGTWLFFAAASLGLPGLGNFVGEVLVLVGVFMVSPAIAAVAALGLVASAIYSLWMVQRVLHGPNKNKIQMADLGPRECAIHATLIAATLWLGLYPQTFINIALPAFARMMAPTALLRVEDTAANGAAVAPAAAPAAAPDAKGGAQ